MLHHMTVTALLPSPPLLLLSPLHLKEVGMAPCLRRELAAGGFQGGRCGAVEVAVAAYAAAALRQLSSISVPGPRRRRRHSSGSCLSPALIRSSYIRVIGIIEIESNS